MNRCHADTNPALQAARLLVDAFADYDARFADITRRSKRHFERRDWAAARRDASARMSLYDKCVEETFSRLERCLGERIFSHALWADIAREYATLIEPLLDSELNKTFFNTLTRRFFKTRGVDPEIEFVALDIEPTDRITHPVARHAYVAAYSLSALCERILHDYTFSVPFANATRCAGNISAVLRQRFATWGPLVSVELLDTVFYRERRAYLVGRVFGRENYSPLVIALMNDDDGLRVDAVLTDRDQLAVLFGFTRGYFHADLNTVGDAVVFLRALLPTKPVDELYTVLGRVKQGKTERYRHFFRHLANHPEEPIVAADGERGLVMSVFTLPSYPLVFKLMRDRFGPSKNVSREEVHEKYRLVFHHDRVGRLVDVQEFRHLRFARNRFDPTLLCELEDECSRNVVRDGDDVVLLHCYVERRLRPLNLYLREVGLDAAKRAVLDYGQAIKDLALSNLFPGDLLLKNFGVSRSGRVVFYDYDELCLITECRFRQEPTPQTHEDEMAEGAWYHVGESDVFPEQFTRFLGLDETLLSALRTVHGEIFSVEWWRDVQARLQNGAYIDIPPYPESARLRQPVGANLAA